MLGILLFGVIGIIVFAFVVAVVAWPFVLVHKIRQTRKARKARKLEEARAAEQTAEQAAEPTLAELLGPKEWAAKQELDKAWAEFYAQQRQYKQPPQK